MIPIKKFEENAKSLSRLDFTFGEEKDQCLAYETRDITKKKFEAKQICRYPKEDFDYYPLPENLSGFIFP